MSSTAFEALRHLYENDLYDDLEALASLLFTVDRNCDDVFLSHSERYQALVWYGDVLLASKQFRKAELIFTQALQLKRSTARKRHHERDANLQADVQYRIYQCLMGRRELRLAASTLESIPLKQRSPRVNAALARLYQARGNDRAACSCYKEVLRSNPYALAAINALLELGTKASEISALTTNATSLALTSTNASTTSATAVLAAAAPPATSQTTNVGSTPKGAGTVVASPTTRQPSGLVDCSSNSSMGLDWLPSYVAAAGELFSRNLPKALQAFEEIDQSPALKSSYDVSMMIANIHYCMGDEAQALAAFERAIKADRFQVRGMDMYAALLCRTKKIKELEQLGNHLVSLSEHHAETFVSLGYQCFQRQKYPRACYMCDKALELNPKHVEAILLKAEIHFGNGARQTAANAYNEVQSIAPHRFESYRGLVTCYLADNRLTDAAIAATNATRQLGQTARTLTLRAEVLVRSPPSGPPQQQQLLEKARSYLQRALVHSPAFLPAVYALAEIYETTRNYQAGVQLLQEKLELVGSTLRLHHLLGDFMHKINDHEQALFHYGLALNLDPGNPGVKKGIQTVEQAVGGEQTFEMEMEDDREFGVNNDDDDSDIDGVWSDEF